MKFIKENGLGLIVFLALVAVSIYFYPQFTERVPVQFDGTGNPTQYTDNTVLVYLIPGMYLFLVAFVSALVKKAPEQFTMPHSVKSVRIIIFAAGIVLLGEHLGLGLDPTGGKVFLKLIYVASGIAMIVAGNVFGKTERNLAVGIRLPWTIASEANWKATHRFAGKLMVPFGIGLLAVSFLYTNILIALSFMLFPLVSAAFYSYIYFRKYERNKPDPALS